MASLLKEPSCRVERSDVQALVGGLSQGVPCLASGWSHEAELPFEDVRMAGFAFSPDAGRDALRQQLDELVAEEGRDDRARSLRAVGGTMRARSAAIGREVQDAPGVPSATGRVTAIAPASEPVGAS